MMKFQASLKNEIGDTEVKIADLELEIAQLQDRIAKIKEFEAKSVALLHLAKELVGDREVLSGDSFRVLVEDVMDVLDPIGPEEKLEPTQLELKLETQLEALVQAVPEAVAPNITSQAPSVEPEVQPEAPSITSQAPSVEPESSPIAVADFNLNLLNRLGTIKAISLYQPWANLLITVNPKTGKPFKQFETRDWNTDYRGKILIQSSLKDDMELFTQSDNIAKALGIEIDFEHLPRGYAVAVCDLTDCVYIGTKVCSEQPTEEIICGNWQNGRWAWKLENIQLIDPPIPLKGKQKLWDVDVLEWLKSEAPHLFERVKLNQFGFTPSLYSANEEVQHNELAEEYKNWGIYLEIPNGGITACIICNPASNTAYVFPVGDTPDDYEFHFDYTDKDGVIEHATVAIDSLLLETQKTKDSEDKPLAIGPAPKYCYIPSGEIGTIKDSYAGQDGMNFLVELAGKSFFTTGVTVTPLNETIWKCEDQTVLVDCSKKSLATGWEQSLKVWNCTIKIIKVGKIWRLEIKGLTPDRIEKIIQFHPSIDTSFPNLAIQPKPNETERNWPRGMRLEIVGHSMVKGIALFDEYHPNFSDTASVFVFNADGGIQKTPTNLHLKYLKPEDELAF